MLNPCAFFLISQGAVLALVRLIAGVPVLHVLLEGKLTREFALAFRALVQFLAARMFTQFVVCQVAAFFEGHRARVTGEGTFT